MRMLSIASRQASLALPDTEAPQASDVLRRVKPIPPGVWRARGNAPRRAPNVNQLGVTPSSSTTCEMLRV